MKEPMTLIERLETIGMVVMMLAWVLLVFKIFFDKIIQYEFYAGICLFFLIASFCFALSSPIIYSLGMLPPAVVSWILYWDSKLTYQKQVRGGIKR